MLENLREEEKRRTYTKKKKNRKRDKKRNLEGERENGFKEGKIEANEGWLRGVKKRTDKE